MSGAATECGRLVHDKGQTGSCDPTDCLGSGLFTAPAKLPARALVNFGDLITEIYQSQQTGSGRF